MQEDKFSLKVNLCECFSYAFISNLGYSTRRNSLFFFMNIKNYITWNFSHFLRHAVWKDVSNDKEKQERVNLLSLETYILSKTFTVHSLYYQILESSKERSLQAKLVFYFLFLWNAVLGSAVFFLCFMWRISSNDIKQ